MRISIISSVCAGLVLVAHLALAQTPSGPTTRRPDPIQGELQRRFEAEAIEKVLSRKPHATTNRERRELLDQIRTDFLRIQIVNDELHKATVPADWDFRAISNQVAEISRRSKRLKQNLSLPKVETGNSSSPASENTDYLREQIALLSKAIGAFVANPIFESAKIVNMTLSMQASRDLEQIILSANEIKRSANRLRRS